MYQGIEHGLADGFLWDLVLGEVQTHGIGAAEAFEGEEGGVEDPFEYGVLADALVVDERGAGGALEMEALDGGQGEELMGVAAEEDDGGVGEAAVADEAEVLKDGLGGGVLGEGVAAAAAGAGDVPFDLLGVEVGDSGLGANLGVEGVAHRGMIKNKLCIFQRNESGPHGRQKNDASRGICYNQPLRLRILQ